jgi:probable HAF family extracellular repeat protein
MRSREHQRPAIPSWPSLAAWERLEARRLLSTYTLTDLAAVGAPGVVSDINDAGQVAGVAAGRAYVWQDGMATDLGDLGGAVAGVADLNNLGHVIGMAAPAPGAPPVPFLWRDGAMRDLGMGSGAQVVAINDSDQIVGNASGRAFLWQDGALTDLGELFPGGGAGAADINNAGVVVGSAYTGRAGTIGLPVYDAFQWQDGVMTDVGTPGFTISSYPASINNAGQFVGSTTVYVNTGYGAAVISKSLSYDGTTLTTLPVGGLQNWAWDVNDAGQVVGSMDGRAYLYEGGVAKDLNTLLPPGTGAVLTAARAVNRSGRIIGSMSNGHSFLLTPDGPAPAGPEVQVWVGGGEVRDGGGDVDFGQTTLGAPVSRTVFVRNVGSAALDLTGPVSLPGGFSLASGMGATTVAPGGVTSFVLRLDAAAAGAFGGGVSFGTNDADEGTFNFAVSGAVTTGRIVDDGSAGFALSGARAAVSAQGYQGDARMMPPANRLPGSLRMIASPRFRSTAAWSFGTLAAGTYRVSATWVSGPTRATNAPFTVYSGATPLVTRTMNQRVAPDDVSVDGAAWEDLGYFTVAGGALTVRLSNQANGWVVADAVRVERVAPSVAAPPVSARTPFAPAGRGTRRTTDEVLSNRS